MSSSIVRLAAVLTLVLGFPLQLSMAETIYIGDDAASGKALTDLGDPDGANGGNVTYAFDTDAYVNGSGSAESWKITEVNFWGDDGFPVGVLTPYVAIYNGAGVGGGANYSVLAVGDPIQTVIGLNNASFTVGGENPVVTVNDGEQLVAAFHQSGRIVPFGDGSADYIQQDNQIPDAGALPAPLAANANWSDLGRTYSFNVGIEPAIPEPTSLALLIAAIFSLSGMGLMRRRQRTRA